MSPAEQRTAAWDHATAILRDAVHVAAADGIRLASAAVHHTPDVDQHTVSLTAYGTDGARLARLLGLDEVVHLSTASHRIWAAVLAGVTVTTSAPTKEDAA